MSHSAEDDDPEGFAITGERAARDGAARAFPPMITWRSLWLMTVTTGWSATMRLNSTAMMLETMALMTIVTVLISMAMISAAMLSGLNDKMCVLFRCVEVTSSGLACPAFPDSES